MKIEYRIHPSIGVARVGNSRSEFYLAPRSIGGRPIECNSYGDEIIEDGKLKFVNKFKDKEMKIKRQAAKFRIFKYDLDNPNSKPVEVDLSDKNEILSVKWIVHLANKKAAWWEFSEYFGDLMIGDGNTYEQHGIDKRNSDLDGPKRRQLIIDFGPRYLESPHDNIVFNKTTTPLKYPQDYGLPYHQLKGDPKFGSPVKSLGEIKTDLKNNLVVLGGFGNAGGDTAYGSFGGGDAWYDDISDGYVLCDLRLANGQHFSLDAWVIVGPPKIAPEIVNVTSLDDIMFDVAARYLGATPQMYDPAKWKDNKGWNPDYVVNFARDIEPMIKRMSNYRWVANVPSMMNFCMPSFDMKDNSEGNKANRKRYFNYFRDPGENEWGKYGQFHQLFPNDDYHHGIPLMPLNSGSNSVSNDIADKFVTLSLTQYFFLKQWSEGKFSVGYENDILGMNPLDHVDVGNCVGSPMCPGIEVTFSVRNSIIYSKPFRIKHKSKDPNYYFQNGLDPLYDETNPEGGGVGCEPGDLTKRMAIPWQSDLLECDIAEVNFTNMNKERNSAGLEKPPTYHVYWWPPQRPIDVILGVTDQGDVDSTKRENNAVEELKAAGISAGQQASYTRGINSHMQMITAWSYLGFIVNQNEEEGREDYPYFVEKERDHDKFEVVGVAVAHKVNLVDPGPTKFVPGFHLKDDAGYNELG